MLARLSLPRRVSRKVLNHRFPGLHAHVPPLWVAAQHVLAGPTAPEAQDLEAAAAGGGDPHVAQLLEEYVVGWAAGTIRRYRRAPNPPGTLPGHARWCRTLRHDIMKDVCRAGTAPHEEGAPPFAPGPQAPKPRRRAAAHADGASPPTPGPPAPKLARRKLGNSAFKRAEHYRLLCNGESWRLQQRRKKVARVKWAGAMQEAPLLAFLSRLADEVRDTDGYSPEYIRLQPSSAGSRDAHEIDMCIPRDGHAYITR